MLSMLRVLAQVEAAGGSRMPDVKFLGMPEEKWIVVLIVLAIVAVAWLIYKRETGTAGSVAKVILGTLRILIVLLVLFVLFEPVFSTEESQVRDSFVVVLIDESLSMDFTDFYSDPSEMSALATAIDITEDRLNETKRLDIVKSMLARNDVKFIERLLAKNSLKIFTFSSGIRLYGEGRKGEKFELAEGIGDKEKKDVPFSGLAAKGSETRIGDSLNEALNFLKGQRVAGVIIISDGRDTESGMFDPKRVADAAGLRDIPVFTVGVGNPEKPKDIALEKIDAREVVLLNDKVSFDFVIRSRGYEGQDITATLRFGEDVKESKQIKLRGENREQRETLNYTPKEKGEYEVVLELTVKQGEQFKDNNKLTHHLKVVDKKIGVLYVECYPRWEYRYLKNALLRDKTMKVHCLLQSADEGFPQECSPDLEPLTGFPATRNELFDNYHVIILGDIDPTHPKQPITVDQMKLIKEFVQDKRGGLLFVAGENYSPGCFSRTPLENLVPIVPERPGSGWTFSEPKTSTFHMLLTPEGREHEVMKLLSEKDANIELWEDNDRREANSLPGFYWYFPSKKAKPGAIVLATHPKRKIDDRERVPLIATMYTGGGVAMFVGVDSTWRWRAGIGDAYFYRFWSQAVRFLSKRILLGSSKHHSISTDKPSYYLNQQINITARILDKDYRPLEAEKQRVNMRTPDGLDAEIELMRNPKRPGTYSGSVYVRQLGWHKLWIGIGAEDPEKGMAFTTFNVEVPELESKKPEMNKKLLQEMASLTKGRYFEIYDVANVPDQIEEIIETIETKVSEDRLWDKNLHQLLVYLGLRKGTFEISEEKDDEKDKVAEVPGGTKEPFFLMRIKLSNWLIILFVTLLGAEWIGRKLRRLI